MRWAMAGASGLIDTLTNSAVNLSLKGGAVEGRSAVGDVLVFTITVDASGAVTLDQLRSVLHDDPLDPLSTALRRRLLAPTW